MLKATVKMLIASAGICLCAVPGAVPAYAARYNVYCAAPNGLVVPHLVREQHRRRLLRQRREWPLPEALRLSLIK